MNQDDYKALKRQSTAQGMAIGLILFLPVGFLLSIAVDNYAFIGIGLPIGVAIGAAIGQNLFQRKLKELDNEGN